MHRSLRKRTRTETRLDQLLAYLKEHTQVRVIDVRSELREAKTREQVYEMTDSHWNDRGAYIAYAALIYAIGGQFPGLSPMPREEFADAVRAVPGGDCARLIGRPKRISESSFKLLPKVPRVARRSPVEGTHTSWDILAPFVMERPGTNLPRAVMLHDSFGGHLAPFLSEHFQRIVYAWERPDFPIFDSPLVERERPDIVIQQLVERKLGVYCPDGSGDRLCESVTAWSRCSNRAE
jgi:hypothetical protein